MHRTLLPLAGALIALTLTGCVPAAEPPTPTASAPTAFPSYATDEEALAAAEIVYREYLGAISAGPDFERLAAVTTPEQFEDQEQTYERLSHNGSRAEGSSELVRFTLQRYGDGELTAYACVDVSSVVIRDASGRDVTPSDRPPQSEILVTLVESQTGFLLEGSDLWSSTCS